MPGLLGGRGRGVALWWFYMKDVWGGGGEDGEGGRCVGVGFDVRCSDAVKGLLRCWFLIVVLIIRS